MLLRIQIRYPYDVNSHAITMTNTDIDNLLNAQANTSINTSINTYIISNTTMNNPNTNINIKSPTNTIIIFILI